MDIFSESILLPLVLFFFDHAHDIQTFSGPGSNLSHSGSLCHSCGNAESLTHYDRTGNEPVPPQ